MTITLPPVLFSVSTVTPVAAIKWCCVVDIVFIFVIRLTGSSCYLQVTGCRCSSKYAAELMNSKTVFDRLASSARNVSEKPLEYLLVLNPMRSSCFPLPEKTSLPPSSLHHVLHIRFISVAQISYRQDRLVGVSIAHAM